MTLVGELTHEITLCNVYLCNTETFKWSVLILFLCCYHHNFGELFDSTNWVSNDPWNLLLNASKCNSTILFASKHRAHLPLVLMPLNSSSKLCYEFSHCWSLWHQTQHGSGLDLKVLEYKLVFCSENKIMFHGAKIGVIIKAAWILFWLSSIPKANQHIIISLSSQIVSWNCNFASKGLLRYCPLCYTGCPCSWNIATRSTCDRYIKYNKISIFTCDHKGRWTNFNMQPWHYYTELQFLEHVNERFKNMHIDVILFESVQQLPTE